MDWTEVVRRNHLRAQNALAQQVNQMGISVPLGDGDYDAPGFLHLGQFYSCVPDPAFPWEPTVLAAIREIIPDAVPLVIRSVWRWSNYAEKGYIDEEMVLTHHGIGRAIQDPWHKLHDFRCEMPSAPLAGFVIPGRNLSDCRPNYIETYWMHSEIKPFGHDLPGLPLPFDWRLFNRYQVAEADRRRALAASKESVDSDGMRIAVGAADATIREEMTRKATATASAKDIQAYVHRDLSRYYSEIPSDVELKQKHLGNFHH